MCKDCAGLLSPFTTDRRKTTLDEIKDHLAYREANKAEVAAFNVTRTIGDRTKVMLDEDKGKFIVTSSGRWQGENPDVIAFSQVTGCSSDIRENRTEIKYRDSEGKMVGYHPPRYDIDYNFYVKIYVNSPYFNEIEFQLNRNRVDQRNSVGFREFERQADEIITALTQVRQEVRDGIAAANAPKVAQICQTCGASAIPDASGRCEYCGAAMVG